MAGLDTLKLSAAVSGAGGLGALGALTLSPAAIGDWAKAARALAPGPFQINLWTPDPPPVRDQDHETRVRAFLARWGPKVPDSAGEARLQDFDAQAQAILEARCRVVSTIMGLLSPQWVERFRDAGLSWWATATTAGEARAAQAAGAEAIIAQGAEAGGHRGAFLAADAERTQTGLMALIPAITDAVDLPVIAAGGIADGRGVAAALSLGASAVQVGTGFLRAHEAVAPPAWAEALSTAWPEDTRLTRGFSGRAGRALATAYVRALEAPEAPAPAPYPVQRGLSRTMREAAQANNDLDGMQAWAGQSARLARAAPAAEIMVRMWGEARALLGAPSLA
jgi:nitronate monooxygenase